LQIYGKKINLYQVEKTFFDKGQRNPYFSSFYAKTLLVVLIIVVPLHREKREQAAPQHKNKFFCIRFALSLHREKENVFLG